MSEAAANNLLSFRVDPSLYQIIKNDAERWGLSLSDIARLRIMTGHLPNLQAHAAEDRPHV